MGNNGLIGLSLQNSGGTTAINLQSDGTNWSLDTGAGNVVIGTDTAGTSYRFALTDNGGSSYSYTFIGSAGGSNLTATHTISGITQANFFERGRQQFAPGVFGPRPEPRARDAFVPTSAKIRPLEKYAICLHL